jgi:HrpA-like RNA helicase
MAVPIGDEVGYMVRGDSKAGARTRLVFCTYGVLLRRLQADPLLQGVDYVVLDEVHERGLESDFALALLASALQRGAKLKLILMSATISTDKFAIYLGERTAIPTANLGPSAQIVPAPVLAIPGFTFPVTEFHKNDYEALVRPTGEDGIGLGGGIGGRRRKGDVDMDLLVRLVLCLATGLGDKKGGDAEAAKSSAMFARATGTVLVFMPGVPEISRFISLVQDAWASRGQYLPSSFGGSDGGSVPILKLLSLHGQLSPAEQRRVFEPCGRGELKVVVATNVAEASVTIPDVTVVIDSCRVKEMAYDEEKQMAALVTKMASQDSLRQRRGRAGRVQAGRCFRSVTAHTHSTLPPTAVPEMLRAPLDRLVLQIKAMDLEESVSQLLRRCPDPPTRSAVLFATGALVRIQALDAEEALTPLGRHLAALPCSPKVGRLLIFGCLLRCAAPASVVAAYLTSRSPFLSAAEPEARNAVDAARARLLKSCAPSCRSDHLLLVEALRGFEACSGASERRRYCRDNALSFDRAQEILQLQAELLDGVAALGFVSSSREALNPRAPCNAHADKPLVVSAALCAGLYPQLAKILRPPKRFVEVMGSALEREVHGKELKFFLPLLPDEQTGGGDASKNVDNDDFDIDTKNMQRVFLHPSSVNVTNATFQASPFVLYGERQATANAAGERAYIRDTTEVTSFPLLFFGGKLEAQYADGTVTVDGWIKFSAPGRLVALVGALRRELDGLLLAKMADPDLDLDSSPVLAATCRLLACNGQG